MRPDFPLTLNAFTPLNLDIGLEVGDAGLRRLDRQGSELADLHLGGRAQLDAVARKIQTTRFKHAALRQLDPRGYVNAETGPNTLVFGGGLAHTIYSVGVSPVTIGGK